MAGYRFFLPGLATVVGLSSLVAGVAVGDDVQVSSLIESVPVLSADNEALQSFQLVGEIALPSGIPVVFEAGWTRSEGFGLAQVDHLGFPILFTAQKQLMLYDASEGVVTLDDDSSARVVVQVADRRLAATCGACSSQDAKFIVDVPSFIPDAQSASRVLTHLRDDLWEITYVKPNGLELALLFKTSEQWPLQRMTVSANGKPVLIIRDITINNPVPKRLLSFPTTDAFPAGIVTRHLTEQKADTVGEMLSVSAGFARALAAPAAIRNPELRSYPFSNTINWDDVKRAHSVNGPKLSALLGVDIRGRTLK